MVKAARAGLPRGGASRKIFDDEQNAWRRGRPRSLGPATSQEVQKCELL